MGTLIPNTWTAIARSAHYAPGVWFEMHGAVLSIPAAHKLHDNGTIYMANKRDDQFTYLVVKARGKRGMNS